MVSARIVRGHRPMVAALRALVLVGLAGYAYVIVGPGGPAPGSDWEQVLNGVTGFGAALLCLSRAVLVRRQRWAWLVMGLGLMCSATGDYLWAAWIRHLDPEPSPSVADWIWLAFYPCAYITIMLLLRSTAARFSRSMWLDGVVGGLGAAALAAALAFQTILANAEGSPAAIATNLAYPIADLLLLVLAVGVLASVGWHPHRAWPMLAAGMVGYAVADSLYLYRLATGTYQESTWLELLWTVAAVLFGLAAWAAPGQEWSMRLSGWTVLVLPSGATLGALAVLVFDHFYPVSTLAIGLATVCLAAAGIRAVLAFAEVRALADSRRLARTDDLTGLANRRGLHQRLDAALAARRADGSVALLLVDLARFKEVNDALGDHVGDQLLREIGPRLQSRVRPEDLLARLGGDQFALVLDATDAATAAEIAGRLLAALADPFDLEGVALHVDAHIGIAVCPDHAESGTALRQRAGNALAHAKATRTGAQVFTVGGAENSRDRLQTIEDLRVAVASDGLLLHYQPKLDLATGRVTGVEALVRWQHARHGLLHPDSFLPLAEQTGLIRGLTYTVLRMALGQCRAWRLDGLDLSVAVNLSVANLVDAHLPTEIASMLAEFGLPPSALELEITESTLMVDTERSQAVLTALRGLGVRLAIDDYGTGYSSLSYLQHLAIDDLKLDKSFIQRMTGNAGAAAIVASTIDLAHRLGLRLVAEGVETEEQLRELVHHGCDTVQGYHISRPVPAADLTAWLQANRRPLVPAAP